MTLFNRIWLGDSIDLLKKLNPGSVQSLITDPPFGVDNQSNSATTPDGKKMARKIANDQSPEQAMDTFAKVWASMAPAMRPNSDIYVFTSFHVLEDWLMFTRALFGEHGYERKSIGVWEKDGPGQGDTTYKSWGNGMEFILYYKRGKRASTEKRRNFVLHAPQLRPDELIHPHEKPIGLLQTLIKHSTDPGDFVVDPFGGSGSLVRAARACGRSALGIELDPENHRLATEKLDHVAGGFDFD